ncbi:MAG: hypothetical protein ABI969_02720 [bacterium]
MLLTNEERAKRAEGMTDDGRKAPPAMSCAECKNILRTVYFNLDGRPLCPKCQQIYRERIDRGTGSAAMGRAILYGTGAAIAGMLGVGLLLMFVGAFRIIASVGVAYLVAKAIGKATANYGGRHYQILAVSLTYLALGFAMLFPVIRAAREYSKAAAPARHAARTGPAGESAEIKDELNSQANPVNDAEEDPAVVAARTDSIAQADSIQRIEQTRANLRASDGNMSAASRLTGSLGTIIIGAIGLLFVLPILSSFSYGIYAGVLSIFGLGFAMKKAWELTELVTDYELTGPFRVGEGPIAPTIGG